MAFSYALPKGDVDMYFFSLIRLSSILSISSSWSTLTFSNAAEYFAVLKVDLKLKDARRWRPIGDLFFSEDPSSCCADPRLDIDFRRKAEGLSMIYMVKMLMKSKKTIIDKSRTISVERPAIDEQSSGQ